MQIDPDRCIGCTACLPYCPVDAITMTKGKAVIDDDVCVECGNCKYAKVCPYDAIHEVELPWPQGIRALSDANIPQRQYKPPAEMRLGGRTTMEVKGNDVVERYGFEDVGFVVDVGRPAVGASFADVEKVTMAVAPIGVEFEPRSLVGTLMTDSKTGKLREDVLGERILYVTVDFKTGMEKISRVVEALRRASKEVDTVFSVGFICRIRGDYTIPAFDFLDQLGVSHYPNAKINMGLGRRHA
ncbi:MAG: DUF362 domain-containing protein [Candidatus Bathyarchaeia archaeon]